MGNFRFLSVFLKKKTVHTLKQNSYLMIFPNLKTGELCTERMPELLINAYSLAQFENLGELVKNGSV